MFSTISEVLVRVMARLHREEGQGLTEYALILSLVSVALVLSLTALAGGIDGVFDAVIGSF